MNNKIFIYVAIIICLTALCFSFTACNVDKNSHIHTFSFKWSMNTSHHWHEASCEHTEEKSEYDIHIDEDNDYICDICTYKTIPDTPNTPTTYSVKFDTNGGEFLDGETEFTLTDIYEDSKIETPIRPKRNGYNFIGWCRSKYSSVTWDFDNDKVSNNLILYALWDKIQIRDSAVQTYAEQQKRNNQARFYTSDINGNSTSVLSSKELEQAIAENKITIGAPIEGKKPVYKKRSATYGMNDLSYWGANENITYVGSMLKMNHMGTELAPIIGLERNPLTISLNLEGSYGIEYKPKTVNSISQSSINQAINAMVKECTGQNAQWPYIISAQLTEIKAAEELNAALGLSFNVGSYFNFSTEFDFANKGDQTYALLTLKQIYFKVNADYDTQQGAYSLLSDKTTVAQLQNACGDFCPVYVSSVSYGRIAAITLKSNKSFSSIKAEINMKSSFGHTETNNEIGKIEKIDNIDYNWFIYGGSISGNQQALNGSNIQEMLKHLNQPYDPAKQIGLPISYQLSFIADNSSAQMGFVGDYYYCEYEDTNISSEPTVGKYLSIQQSFNVEKRIIDGYKDYISYGSLCIADNSFLRVYVSDLDKNYINYLKKNIEIKIELQIKEVDDGYQEIYLYNAGVNAKTVQAGQGKPIAQIEIEHGVGIVNNNYSKYCLTAVISPDLITEDELWIAFDSWGDGDDTWYAKDISITLSSTEKNVKSMYAVKV